MRIFWDNDMGQPMFMLDQLVMHRTVRNVYHYFGIHGVLYMINFYWEGSPFATEDDYEKRHLQVIHNSCSTEEFDIFKGQLIPPPPKSKQPHYQNIHVLQAGKDVNALAPVPELLQANWHRAQIDKLRKEAEVNLNNRNAAEKKDFLVYQKLVLANIDTMEKTYNSILGIIKDKVKKEVAASLSDFISQDGKLEDSDSESRNGKLEISVDQ